MQKKKKNKERENLLLKVSLQIVVPIIAKLLVQNITATKLCREHFSEKFILINAAIHKIQKSLLDIYKSNS